MFIGCKTTEDFINFPLKSEKSKETKSCFSSQQNFFFLIADNRFWFESIFLFCFFFDWTLIVAQFAHWSIRMFWWIIHSMKVYPWDVWFLCERRNEKIITTFALSLFLFSISLQFKFRPCNGFASTFRKIRNTYSGNKYDDRFPHLRHTQIKAKEQYVPIIIIGFLIPFCAVD